MLEWNKNRGTREQLSWVRPKVLLLLPLTVSSNNCLGKDHEEDSTEWPFPRQSLSTFGYLQFRNFLTQIWCPLDFYSLALRSCFLSPFGCPHPLLGRNYVIQGAWLRCVWQSTFLFSCNSAYWFCLVIWLPDQQKRETLIGLGRKLMKPENLPIIYFCPGFYFITSHAVVGKLHHANRSSWKVQEMTAESGRKCVCVSYTHL